MATLRTAMDAGFWDLNISTAQSVDGVARSVPGEPFPMDVSRANRFLRFQQLSAFGYVFPLGIIPHWSPTPHKELGPFALQSSLRKAFADRRWLGLVGQVRPKKLIAALKAEVSQIEEWDISVVKDLAMTFLEKSVYSVGLLSQIALGSSGSLLLNMEKHGERKGINQKLMIYQQLPSHDVTFEAAWPELFIDSKGKYWEVPESISLDCLSLVSDSGLRYRFGFHKNGGLPKAVDSSTDEAPLTLLPGFCAKAALSYEKSKDIWRQKQRKKDLIIDTPVGKFLQYSYDSRLSEPHVSVSGIIGAACASWVSFGKSTTLSTNSSKTRDSGIHSNPKTRSPFSVNLFGSGCCTFQHGKFRNPFGDLTRIDVRLDFPEASLLLKQFSNAADRNPDDVLSSSPRLNFIFQQQVAGPVVFRVDSRMLLGSSTGGGGGPHFEDIMFSLNYHLRGLPSAKFVAWYSPKRKEAMLEFRTLEF